VTQASSTILDARALLAKERHGVLCTASADHDGWPYGSLVPYAPLPGGDVVVVISTLAEHTQNAAKDPRVTLLVADGAAAERPQTGARMALMARAERLEGRDREEALSAYLERFPQSRAIASMGDFGPWRLRVERVRWIGGFAAAAWIGRERWTSAT
jgi:hypothetical protein